MSKAATKKKDPVVETVVRDDKTKSVNSMFQDSGDESAPVFQAVGYAQVPGTNQYVSYTLFIQNGAIIKVEVEEPNLRAIAEESSKLNFVNIFMTQG